MIIQQPTKCICSTMSAVYKWVSVVTQICLVHISTSLAINIYPFLNQVCAAFLEIALVCVLVCVYVCLCVCP